MQRFLQVPVGCLLAGALAILFADLPSPAADEKLPRIDKLQHQGYVQTIPGANVKFEMVPIPGGTYMMGSPDKEPGRQPDEGPQHPVTIRPFWMGKMEVTWDEYDLYWKPDLLPKPEKPTPPYADETFGHGREGNPVLCITHHAAMQYCQWLSDKTGKTYRLPTEAEWEWAARAGTTTPYFFGDDATQLGDYAWFAGNSEDVAHPVGKKKPSPWGLLDIYGNLAEWCLDHYQKDYYASFPAGKPTLEPCLVPTEKRFSHVARGGS